MNKALNAQRGKIVLLTGILALSLTSCRKTGSTDSASTGAGMTSQKITFITPSPIEPATVKGGSTTMVVWPVVSDQSMIVSVSSSSDSGQTWTTIEPYLVNTGMYAFTAPVVDSTTFRLKVAGETGILAMSDTFRIVATPPRLASARFISSTGMTLAEFKSVAVFSNSAPANPQLSGIKWTLDLSDLVESPLEFKTYSPVTNSQRGGVINCVDRTCTYDGPSTQTAGGSKEDSFIIFLRDAVGNQGSNITVSVDPTYIPSVGGTAGGPGGTIDSTSGGTGANVGSPQSRPAVTAEPGPAPGTQTVDVSTAAQFLTALANAAPGDEITLAPGTYAFTSNISVTKSGTQAQPIYIRAASPGTVTINMQNKEGFVLYGVSDLVFENLKVVGVNTMLNTNAGGSPNWNEHSFHIKASSNRITIRHNDVVNFMSHVKVDAGGSDPAIPTSNEIRFIENVFRDTKRIRGYGPFNALNIDGGYNHVLRGNRFVDLVSDNANRSTSSIYLKMGTRHAVAERNLIVCQKYLNSANASLRGIFSGDTSLTNPLCPLFEGTLDCVNHNNIYRNNIIINCKDMTGNRFGVGLKTEDSAEYVHNTSYDGYWTYVGSDTGPDVVLGHNILTHSGTSLYAPQGDTVQLVDNLLPTTTVATDYWIAPAIGDFTLKAAGTSAIVGKVPRLTNATDDYCGNPRSSTTSIGAIEYDHPGATACVNFIKNQYLTLPSSL